MEKKLLVVKDLPECSEDTIINYLEIICDNGVEAIHFYDDRAKHIALVTMETDIEDFSSCQQKTKKRCIEGKQVTLVEVSPADGILVKELPPRITEDTLRFYFETPKAGGTDDSVTDSIIWKNLQVATVFFNDTNVVQCVLKKDSHKPQKNSPAVEVTPYYRAFHEDVLHYLNSLQPSSPSSSGYTTPDTGSPSTTPRTEETWSVLTAPNTEETWGLVTTPRTEETWSSLISAKTSSNTVKSQDNGLSSPEADCPWKSVLATPLSESTSAMVSLSYQSEHTFEASQQEQSRNQVKEVKQVRELVKSHEALLSNAAPPDKPPKPNLVAPRPPQKERFQSVERMNSLDDVDENDLFPDLIPQLSSHVPELANRHEALHSRSAPPERPPKPKPKPKPTPKPKPADVPEETISKTSVPFHEAHVKLLKASRVENDFPKCKLTFKNASIIIEGPEHILQEVTLKLYEKNHVISASTHEVSPVIAEILKSQKGKSYLENELMLSGTSTCYVKGTTMHCVSFSESETQTMIKDLKKLIGQETVHFDQSHVRHMKSPEWKAMHDRFEKKMMVKVTHNAGENKLSIDGLSVDVKLVKDEMLGELKRHAHVSKQFVLSGAKAKCMKTFFQKDVADIKQKLCSQGGGMDDTGSMSSLKLTMEGTPKDVDDKIRRLKQLEDKVWHERLHLGKEVAKEKDLNLLVRGIQRSNPKAMVASFEANHPCFLDLNLPAMTASPASSTTSSGYEKLSKSHSLEKLNSSDSQVETIRIFDDHRPSAHFVHPIAPPVVQATSVKVGSITVSVHKGDVTKEKCDVLVNVVSRSLTLGETAVSSAFMKSGAAEFIQQFDVMKMGYAPGNIIQTPAFGNLPAKKVFTIVLEKWNPPKSKTDLKALIDKCLKTANAAAFTSIAFAAVGCGKLLHFPEKFVASAILSTIRNNSLLQNLKIVKLVLYDRQTYQKFLDEISPRPSLRHSFTFAGLEEEPGAIPGDSGIPSSKSITDSGTKITVQQGDITKFRATVLVNMVTEDLDLRSTAVSQAFARAGGKPFVQEFEMAKSTPATSGIIVTSGGNLPCRYVYHVMLKKWHSSSQQEYTDIIRECFKMAEGYNTPSIAFPSLGCGVLLKYPPYFVASCLIDCARASSVANVTFVVYDQPVLQIFMDQLTSGTAQAASHDDTRQETDDYATLRQFAKTSKEGRVPTAEAKTANIVIYGKDKKTCNDAKAALAQQLKDDFLYTEIIDHEDLLKLNKKSIESMQSTAKHNGIWIKFPNPDKRSKKGKPQLKLKGEKECVLLVKVKVQDILLQTKKTEHRPKPTKGKRGTREFLAEMGSMTEFHTPSYWTQFKNTKTLGDMLKGFLLPQSPKSSHHLVKVDKTTYNAIDTLVQKTWDSTLVGHGKDAINLHHKAINVTDIQRLENPELFKRYCQKRSSRFTDACRIGRSCMPVEKLPGSSGPVKTSVQKIDVLTKDMYSEVNEYYFFHGTKIDKLQAILTSGLDSRVGNINAMFGSGVYGAESSTKADQYTDDKQARTPVGKQMMLMRMTLGEPFITSDKNSPKYRRPPCRDKNHRAETCDKDHGQCHSVIGDGSWLFREFVVYEPELCYPEYIITYNRI